MLVLASKSPRRKEFLQQLGVEFQCQSADIDETPLDNELPTDYVMRLAVEKAKAVLALTPSSYVLGSDTCVVVDGEILGKPENQQDSIRMLSLLSGRKHHVYTAVAIISEQQVEQKLVCSEVDFAPLTEQEMIAYWHTGEPQDKAGSYGIQGIAGQFIKSIQGSYSSIVGLPLYETASLLKKCNIATALNVGVYA